MSSCTGPGGASPGAGVCAEPRTHKEKRPSGKEGRFRGTTGRRELEGRHGHPIPGTIVTNAANHLGHQLSNHCLNIPNALTANEKGASGRLAGAV